MNTNLVRNTFSISLAGFRENNDTRYLRDEDSILFFFILNQNFKKILEFLIVIFTSHYVFCIITIIMVVSSIVGLHRIYL